MPTRRSYIAFGVTLSTSLAGCTVSVDNPLNQGEESQNTEPAGSPTNDTEPSTGETEDEPSADFTIFDMAPLDGYQVSVRVEVGDADEIRIIDDTTILKTITEDGRYQIAGGDDDEDAPLHYEDVETGKEFYAFAYYENELEPSVELANTRAV